MRDTYIIYKLYIKQSSIWKPRVEYIFRQKEHITINWKKIYKGIDLSDKRAIIYLQNSILLLAWLVRGLQTVNVGLYNAFAHKYFLKLSLIRFVLRQYSVLYVYKYVETFVIENKI